MNREELIKREQIYEELQFKINTLNLLKHQLNTINKFKEIEKKYILK